MRFDGLINPISENEPCGPDLDEIGDDQYLNYMMGADNRLPSRYLDSETGAPFDRAKIDLKAETQAIGAFLEQSRDLRLLTLEARFQALAGQITAFSECLQAMSGLLETFWGDVHPKGFDGDFTLRQNTVGVLEDRTTVILPLQYAPIVRDQRIGSISLRDYLVATGKAQAREEERTFEANQILDMLRSESHRGEVDAMHASLLASLAALRTIQTAFDEGTNYQYSPDFDLLRGVLGDIRKLIETARPDLGSGIAEATEALRVEGSAPSGGEVPSAAIIPLGQPAAAAAAVSVTSHAAAAAALLAAEQYFGRSEPSSPALLLVHQARQLIGKPLVTALEALMPDYAEYASIVIDPSVGFEFNMTKMRAIAEDYAASAEQVEAEAEIPIFEARTRAETLALISGVGAFFRGVEPSSPIPIVLGRAERFMSQSFQSIIAELMLKKAAE